MPVPFDFVYMSSPMMDQHGIAAVGSGSCQRARRHQRAGLRSRRNSQPNHHGKQQYNPLTHVDSSADKPRQTTPTPSIGCKQKARRNGGPLVQK